MADRELPKVLCVDDEINVLHGIKRHLRRAFEVHTATSGDQGLRAIDEDGPFAVVTSDLRMPGLDGIAFLGRVCERAPDSTRVLLTGKADLTAAIAAVNEGNIFRFLSKPCPSDVLLRSVEAAAEQHRLVTAERVLLEQTLHGSIKMLTEILALASPAAFGRATRAKQLAGQLAVRLGTPERWKMEMAAMLSQVGCITLPSETVEKLYHGQELTPSEQSMVDRLPGVAEDLLETIPRLEEVSEILHFQAKQFDGGGLPEDGVKGTAIPQGARILKAVLDLDALGVQQIPRDAALETLRSREGWYDPDVLAAIAEPGADGEEAKKVKTLHVRELHKGMELLDDVVDVNGRLLVAHGQEVSAGLLERLRNFSENVGLKEPLRVLVDTEQC